MCIGTRTRQGPRARYRHTCGSRPQLDAVEDETFKVQANRFVCSSAFGRTMGLGQA